MRKEGRLRAGIGPSVVLAAALASGSAGAESVDPGARLPARELRELVPRSVQVSISLERAWTSVSFNVRPQQLGLADWSAWDSDGSGGIEAKETIALLEHVRDRESAALCLAVAGRLIRTAELPIRHDGLFLPLGDPLRFRAEGSQPLSLGPGRHAFLLYDLPAAPDGFTPIRLSVAAPLRVESFAGAIAETRGERRLEAAVTRGTPAVWGEIEVPGSSATSTGNP
jgi:hypothetical protein